MILWLGEGEFYESIEVFGGVDCVCFEVGRGWDSCWWGLLKGGDFWGDVL